jgi:predicted dinucleotide-binding enzyme
MRIAVIGAGNVGGTLGRRWAALGHEVVFGVRDPERGAAAVKGGETLPARASVATPADAVRGADAVVLTTPWGVVASALNDAGANTGALDGVPVLDATNPLGPNLTLLSGANGESGAEQVQAMIPRAHVVKVFNSTGYNNMADPVYGGAATVMLYAGNDSAAKAVTGTLVKDLGFDAVDAGALIRARELEHLALLWISMAFGGQGREIAFRLVRR